MKKACLGLLMLLSLGLVIAVLPEEQMLVIREGETKKILWAKPVGEGQLLSISFVHSVNQSPITESYQVAGEEFLFHELRFQTFGAGMQTELYEGERFHQEGEDMIISGGTRSFSSLHYIVGTISEHVLTISEEELPLGETFGKNAKLSFTMEKRKGLYAK